MKKGTDYEVSFVEEIILNTSSSRLLSAQ